MAEEKSAKSEKPQKKEKDRKNQSSSKAASSTAKKPESAKKPEAAKQTTKKKAVEVGAKVIMPLKSRVGTIISLEEGVASIKVDLQSNKIYTFKIEKLVLA